MSRLKAAALALAMLVGVGTARAQSPAPPAAALQRFPVGETLVFEAKYGILTLGSAMMHVAGIDTVRGVSVVHTVFVLRGGPFFYRLDDRMDSWFGLGDFASRRFVQDFQEGGSKRYSAYEIYPDSGYYIQEGVDSVFPTSPDPLDDTAFFYFARTMELEVGQRYELQRYFRPDRNPVILEVVGRDTLDLPAGRFPTLVVHPIIQGRGILAEANEPRMWISDDDRRLIVQLKSKFPFGTITLRLKEIASQPPPELAAAP